MTNLTCPPMHGDAASLARALLTVPAHVRGLKAVEIVDRAKTAKIHVKCYGQCHPEYGNGSIMSAARLFADLPPEPDFTDTDYIDCFIHALQTLRALARAEALSRGDVPEDQVLEAAE